MCVYYLFIIYLGEGVFLRQVDVICGSAFCVFALPIAGIQFEMLTKTSHVLVGYY